MSKNIQDDYSISIANFEESLNFILNKSKIKEIYNLKAKSIKSLQTIQNININSKDLPKQLYTQLKTIIALKQIPFSKLSFFEFLISFLFGSDEDKRESNLHFLFENEKENKVSLIFRNNIVYTVYKFLISKENNVQLLFDDLEKCVNYLKENTKEFDNYSFIIDLLIEHFDIIQTQKTKFFLDFFHPYNIKELNEKVQEMTKNLLQSSKTQKDLNIIYDNFNFEIPHLTNYDLDLLRNKIEIYLALLNSNRLDVALNALINQLSSENGKEEIKNILNKINEQIFPWKKDKSLEEEKTININYFGTQRDYNELVKEINNLKLSIDFKHFCYSLRNQIVDKRLWDIESDIAHLKITQKTNE